MRLIVADTNILVSAAINATGAPGILVMDWILERQVQVVTCPAVVREYREVMRRSKFTHYRLPPLWLEFLVEESLHLDDPPAWPLSGLHSGDLVLLALARAAGAWLVTGNLRHFPARVRRGVTVLSPAEYLAHLERRP